MSHTPHSVPAPVDDGAAAHLVGLEMPAISLASTGGRLVDLASFGTPRTIPYCYPRTGRPDLPVPPAWDQIPGARGCTPESCGFRDHFRDLGALRASVFGISTQHTDYQPEVVHRLGLPFDLLSDANLELARTLGLPTFTFEGVTLLKRLTLVVRDSRIERVFYPVFPAETHTEEVLRWLAESHRIQRRSAVR